MLDGNRIGNLLLLRELVFCIDNITRYNFLNKGAANQNKSCIVSLQKPCLRTVIGQLHLPDQEHQQMVSRPVLMHCGEYPSDRGMLDHESPFSNALAALRAEYDKVVHENIQFRQHSMRSKSMDTEKSAIQHQRLVRCLRCLLVRQPCKLTHCRRHWMWSRVCHWRQGTM